MRADRRTAPRRAPSRWWAPTLLFLLLGPARGADLFDIPATHPPRVVTADYFGTHFHRLDHAVGGFPATAWPGDVVGSVRLWDSSTRWADLEPTPGRFDFARLDALVDQARAHHANVSLVLGSPPPWASARPNEAGPYGPGSAAEPRDLEQWDRYLSAIMRRYKGRISQYELWNEPYFSDFPADRQQPGAFFSGSAASMVELARRARAAIDREDPQATLLTPGFVGATNRLDLFLKAGGARYVDGVAYHFYVEDDAEFVRLCADVRSVMLRNGLGSRPLFNTESGFAIRGSEGQPLAEGQTPIDRRRAAVLLARSLILGAWLGVDRFYQYAWDNGRMGMLLPDGRTETDSLRAYAAVRRWLLGTTLQGCRSLAGGVVRCEGARGDDHLFIAWHEGPGDGGTFTMPRPFRAVSIEDAVSGPMPVDRDASRSLSLPADGSPVAVWAGSDATARHTPVAQAR